MVLRLATRNVRKNDSGISGLIYAVGFETRSRYVVERLSLEAHRVFGVVYRAPKVLAFEENFGLFKSCKYAGASDEPSELTQGLDKF